MYEFSQFPSKEVQLKEGYLFVDDWLSTKRDANYITLHWTDGEKIILIDSRIYIKGSKHIGDHVLEMLDEARESGLEPKLLILHSLYTSVSCLKTLKKKGWHFFVKLKSDRLVGFNHSSRNYLSLKKTKIPSQGTVAYLRKYDLIKLFQTVDQEEHMQYWGTNVLDMDEKARECLTAIVSHKIRNTRCEWV
jgi:hypothetical protein